MVSLILNYPDFHRESQFLIIKKLLWLGSARANHGKGTWWFRMARYKAHKPLACIGLYVRVNHGKKSVYNKRHLVTMIILP